jgi:hypothetical protein
MEPTVMKNNNNNIERNICTENCTKAVFRKDAAFFLNEETGWADFVNAVIQANAPEQK